MGTERQSRPGTETITLAVTPDQAYILELYSGRSRGHDITVDGVLVASDFGATASMVYSGEFTPAGSTMTLTFDDADGSNDGLYTGLTLHTIPEPATMSLLAIGGLGVLLKRRRRRA